MKPLAPAALRVVVADLAVIRPVLALLIDRGITAISTFRPSLEEVYVHVVCDRGLQV